MCDEMMERCAAHLSSITLALDNNKKIRRRQNSSHRRITDGRGREETGRRSAGEMPTAVFMGNMARDHSKDIRSRTPERLAPRRHDQSLEPYLTLAVRTRRRLMNVKARSEYKPIKEKTNWEISLRESTFAQRSRSLILTIALI
ncbi:hypothetical protein L596_004520 [Steinernema carpocapsae]|uniref:Uncharacterized protein n=1 Tax=Steinernema carpocapsae TaxID=34508 RepID=A0A4U8UX46_STECR|nr:hypothetical protein L596_004520 [Steinernema carpocapsae]